jgi:hypothetical protein
MAEAGGLEVWLGDRESDLGDSIRAAVNSSTRTYRYVLPTQLVAKVADPLVDAQSLQASSGQDGAFDARTIAHKIIVPFDQQNEKVLGGSPEPYVNNPVRLPRVSEEFRNPQKNKKDWDHLVAVLSAVQEANDPGFAQIVLQQVLGEIYLRLSATRVTYPAPLRVSHADTLRLVDTFLAESSGGDRLLAITSALFAILGKRFSLFAEVRRRTITTPDAPSGMLADLECVTEGGTVVLVVEVKDRLLAVTELRSTMDKIRERQIAEIFVIAQQGLEDVSATHQEVGREFAVGHNVYIMPIKPLAIGVLALIGETGRQGFLREVARNLDEYRSDIRHRRAWAELLAAL